MSKDYISCVNLWCQKHGKNIPHYSFEQADDRWVCVATAEWITSVCFSKACSAKKDAKQDCAAHVYKFCNKTESVTIQCQPDTCIIIDGDQRADCWRWLANPNVQWSDTSVTVKVYTGPTTPAVEAGGRAIEHIRAKSPSKDAADAKILMDLGAFLALKRYKHYILVSSDHVLVQVALDTPDIVSAGNLAQLKKYIMRGCAPAGDAQSRSSSGTPLAGVAQKN